LSDTPRNYGHALRVRHIRTESQEQLWSLHYLRAFAAIAVVAFHRLSGGSHPFPLGEYGVDIFFVISGFIMVALTVRRDITAKRFLLDRVARIVPLYWLATISTFILILFGTTIWQASDNPYLLVNLLFFIPTYNEH
jgi:exopolysaccharide production protein ExoZ